MDDLYIVFDDYQYWAMSEEIYLDQIRDSLLNFNGPISSKNQDEDGSSRGSTGVVIGSVFAGLIAFVGIGAVILVRNTLFPLSFCRLLFCIISKSWCV